MIKCVITGRIPHVITRRDLDRTIQLTLRVTRRKNTRSVAVAFVSNPRMKMLNRRYRGFDRPTDVLSFVYASSGDILLSSAFIRSSARTRGVPFRAELLRVTAHGMLHLLGYDHATKQDEERMFGIQERIVQQVASPVRQRRTHML